MEKKILINKYIEFFEKLLTEKDAEKQQKIAEEIADFSGKVNDEVEEKYYDETIQKIQNELSGITETMDKYLIQEISKIQDILGDYEEGMLDVNNIVMSNFDASKKELLQRYDDLTEK